MACSGRTELQRRQSSSKNRSRKSIHRSFPNLTRQEAVCSRQDTHRCWALARWKEPFFHTSEVPPPPSQGYFASMHLCFPGAVECWPLAHAMKRGDVSVSISSEPEV